MPVKMLVDKLKPGMKLAKPVINDSGMILLGEGTELKSSHIDRLVNMNIGSVLVEGEAPPEIPKEEALAELEAKFRKTENEPYMGMIKRLFIEKLEERYK